MLLTRTLFFIFELSSSTVQFSLLSRYTHYLARSVAGCVVGQIALRSIVALAPLNDTGVLSIYSCSK